MTTARQMKLYRRKSDGVLARTRYSRRVICVRLPFPVFVAPSASRAASSHGAGSEARAPPRLAAAPSDGPEHLAVAPFYFSHVVLHCLMKKGLLHEFASAPPLKKNPVRHPFHSEQNELKAVPHHDPPTKRAPPSLFDRRNCTVLIL